MTDQQTPYEGITLMWKNPEEGSNRPHFTGFVTINGVEYEFATWPAKSGKDGVYTGKLKLKQERT